jgi:two-component system response regulator DesR
MILEIEDDKIVRDSKELFTFSSTELKIYKLAKQGLRTKEIANEVNLADKTVRMYLTTIYRKLGIKNKKELVQEHKIGNA